MSPTERALRPWRDEEVLAVLRGDRTLGELAGVSKGRQHQLAALALQLLQQGLKDAARDLFLGLEALDRYDAHVQLCLGAVALDDQSYVDAEQRFSRALELNPELSAAWFHRGLVRVQHLGKREAGLQDLARSLRHDAGRVPELSARAEAMLAAAESRR